MRAKEASVDNLVWILHKPCLNLAWKLSCTKVWHIDATNKSHRAWWSNIIGNELAMEIHQSYLVSLSHASKVGEHGPISFRHGQRPNSSIGTSFMCHLLEELSL